MTSQNCNYANGVLLQCHVASPARQCDSWWKMQFQLTWILNFNLKRSHHEFLTYDLWVTTIHFLLVFFRGILCSLTMHEAIYFGMKLSQRILIRSVVWNVNSTKGNLAQQDRATEQKRKQFSSDFSFCLVTLFYGNSFPIETRRKISEEEEEDEISNVVVSWISNRHFIEITVLLVHSRHTLADDSSLLSSENFPMTLISLLFPRDYNS